MLDGLLKIYDLKEDRRFIDLVQKATLGTKDYGLISENGLFGSEAWWQAIDRGDLEVHLLEGTISRVYMAGHNDWPEFEIHAGEKKSKWERKGDDSAYVPGKRVRLLYVQQLSKRGFGGGRDHNCVLEIWIENSDDHK